MNYTQPESGDSASMASATDSCLKIFRKINVPNTYKLFISWHHSLNSTVEQLSAEFALGLFSNRAVIKAHRIVYTGYIQILYHAVAGTRHW